MKIIETFTAKKKVEIEQFNSDILSLVNPHKLLPTNCTACKKKFSSGSKPLQCINCSLFFNTGCTIAKKRIPVYTYHPLSKNRDFSGTEPPLDLRPVCKLKFDRCGPEEKKTERSIFLC